MNKAELISAIASKAGISKANAKKALDAFMESVTEALVKGERVSLVGFGSWKVAMRQARKGRNPRTKEVIEIPAKKVVKFVPGADLSDKVAK